MSDQDLRDVYVRAVAITRGDSLLMTFNEKWGGFTFPTSKKRPKFHARRPGEALPASTEETPKETAIRVAVEALGRPLRPRERPEPHRNCPTIGCVIVSGRDDESKYYHIELFEVAVGDNELPRPLGGIPTAWMTLDDVASLVPVTIFAEYIAGQIREASGR